MHGWGRWGEHYAIKAAVGKRGLREGMRLSFCSRAGCVTQLPPRARREPGRREGPRHLPNTVSVSRRFFPSLSHRRRPRCRCLGSSELRWLSCIRTSTCLGMLLALQQKHKEWWELSGCRPDTVRGARAIAGQTGLPTRRSGVSGTRGRKIKTRATQGTLNYSWPVRRTPGHTEHPRAWHVYPYHLGSPW